MNKYLQILKFQDYLLKYLYHIWVFDFEKKIWFIRFIFSFLFFISSIRPASTSHVFFFLMSLSMYSHSNQCFCFFVFAFNKIYVILWRRTFQIGWTRNEDGTG
jgi:hypothetical protein